MCLSWTSSLIWPLHNRRQQTRPGGSGRRGGHEGIELAGLLAGLMLVGVVLPCAANDLPEIDNRIESYRQQIAKHPRSWALPPLLAQELLERTRRTGELETIQEIEALLRQSLTTQANASALSGMAALYNYRHRFSEALSWARKAHEADPADSRITGMLVEALLGLGRREEALELLQRAGTPDNDFNLLAAWAQWHAEARQYDQAARSYALAATAAARQGARKQQLWAIINNAGMYLDSGRPDKARPLLEQARAMRPDDLLLRVHEAEYLELTGNAQDAYAIYAELARTHNRPELHARASGLAGVRGDKQQEERHFRLAEAGFLRAVRKGEIFTLEALAGLYCATGRFPLRALEYAEENLRYKKDRAAHETRECARRALPSGFSALRSRR